MGYNFAILSNTINQIIGEVAGRHSLPKPPPYEIDFEVDCDYENPARPYKFDFGGITYYSDLSVESLFAMCTSQIGLALGKSTSEFDLSNNQILRIRDAFSQEFRVLPKEAYKNVILQEASEEKLQETYAQNLVKKICEFEITPMVPVFTPLILQNPYFNAIRTQTGSVIGKFFQENGEPRILYSDLLIPRTTANELSNVALEAFRSEYLSSSESLHIMPEGQDSLKDFLVSIDRIIGEHNISGKKGVSVHTFILSYPLPLNPIHFVTNVLVLAENKKYLLLGDSLANRCYKLVTMQGISHLEKEGTHLPNLTDLVVTHSRMATQPSGKGCGVYALVGALTHIHHQNPIGEVMQMLEFDEKERYLAYKMLRIAKKLQNPGARDIIHLKEKFVEYGIYLSAMYHTKQPSQVNPEISLSKLEQLYEHSFGNLCDVLSETLKSELDCTSLFNVFLNIVTNSKDTLGKLSMNQNVKGRVSQILTGNIPVTEFTKRGTMPNFAQKEAKTMGML